MFEYAFCNISHLGVPDRKRCLVKLFAHSSPRFLGLLVVVLGDVPSLDFFVSNDCYIVLHEVVQVDGGDAVCVSAFAESLTLDDIYNMGFDEAHFFTALISVTSLSST